MTQYNIAHLNSQCFWFLPNDLSNSFLPEPSSINCEFTSSFTILKKCTLQVNITSHCPDPTEFPVMTLSQLSTEKTSVHKKQVLNPDTKSLFSSFRTSENIFINVI